MAQHRERRERLRGGKFEVQLEEGGEGPNLLFLHGAGGYTGWTPFLDALAESFHVYAPAHPGVAGTTGLEHLDDLWDLVIFYEELMEELGLGRSHCVGPLLRGDAGGGTGGAPGGAGRPVGVGGAVGIMAG